MKIILFGATGMVGQGVLRECLLDPDVERVLTVGRSSTKQQHEKLREIEHQDLFDLTPIANELAGYDACLFCLGVSSAGMSEADYRRVTYDLTLSVARLLVEKNPAMTFLYVSGASTDSTERGPSMWARVKGQTENAIRALPFEASYMLRPGFIQPLHGIRSRTRIYRIVYAFMWPFVPIFKLLFPHLATTTEKLGKAMIVAAKRGAPKFVLETPDINALADGRASPSV